MLEEIHLQGKTVNDIEECLQQVPLHTRIVEVTKTAHALGYNGLVATLTDFRLFVV